MNNKGHKIRSFSELKIGEQGQFEVDIDEDIHSAFSKLSGDHSPIHCDEVFSAKTKFKKRIGYAFMLNAFLSRFYGEILPGGSSVCIRQESNFIKPYYLGDRLLIKGEIKNKIESTHFIEIETEIIKNNKDKIFKGKGIVQVLFDNK